MEAEAERIADHAPYAAMALVFAIVTVDTAWACPEQNSTQLSTAPCVFVCQLPTVCPTARMASKRTW